MSAKAKLMLSTGILFALMISFVATVSYLDFRKAAIKSYSERLDTQASLIAESIEQKIQRTLDVLHVVADSVPVDENGQIETQQSLVILKTMENDMNIVSSLIGYENGDTYLSSGLIPNFNAKEKKREWYVRVFSSKKDVITSPFITNAGAGEAMKGVGVNLSSSTGRKKKRPVKKSTKIIDEKKFRVSTKPKLC